MTNSDDDNEYDALMPSHYLTSQHILGPVNPARGDLALLCCCFVSGLLDCAVFNNYGVFVGMQTGNTVILCLSTSGLPVSQPFAYATTLVSIIAFFAGAFATAHVSNALGALRRVTLTANFLLQGLLILLEAILVTANLIPVDAANDGSVYNDPHIIGAIPLLAFQSGATIATSRLLGYGNEIPVNVLTSTYAALATDTRLLAWKNTPRNRRVGACVCVLGGALCAAWIQKVGPGIVGCLWVGAGLKIVMALAVGLFMPAKVVRMDDEG